MRWIQFILAGLCGLWIVLPVSAQVDDVQGPGRRHGGMFRADPNEAFNRIAGGKEVWLRSEIANPWMQRWFDRMAERLGVTSGQISREQFVLAMRMQMVDRAGGPAGLPVPEAARANVPASWPAAAAPGNAVESWTSWADYEFQRLDQNGDGYLNNDEMPEDLRAERDTWDADHNGLIDPSEYRAYFQSRLGERQAEYAGAGVVPWQSAPPLADGTTLAEEQEEHRPPVYRAGKLPKELPSWFQQLDTDGDGQIGLYEWKAAGRAVEEFLKIDRNHDGFLTPEEVLAYEAKQRKQSGIPGGR